MVVFEYLPPLCVHVCLCAFVCVHAYTFLWHCVNFHTHTVYTTHLKWRMPREREREREEWKQKQQQQQQRPQHTIHTGKRTCVVATEVLPYLSLFLPLALSPSPSATSCSVVSRAGFCVCLVTVFGFVFPPIHTHIHIHTSAYKYVWMCAAALLLCLPFCWLPMLTMLCFFLPLIAAPRSRLQIFSNQKRDHV